MKMLYSADGTLLQRKYIKNNVEVSKIDYLRGKERINGELKNIYFSDGRIVKTGAAFSFEYAIKDHLGNVRVTFADDNNNGLIAGAEIRSRNDYYAFGMEWNGRWKQNEFGSTENRYKYNGKEFFDEMNIGQYAYGRRFYDGVLGRFTGVDALSSDFTYVNPYNYAENNPIVNIDLHGLQALNAFQAGLIGNDNQGSIRPATQATRENSPFTAGVGDATFFVLDFLGLNAIDNAFFGSQESTAGQKVSAVGTVLLNTRGGVDDGARATTKVGKINKNANNAESNFVLYQVKDIDTGTKLKIGKADSERITSDGRPVRMTHSERAAKKAGYPNAKADVIEDLGRTTTAKAKETEASRVRDERSKGNDLPLNRERDKKYRND